MDKRIFISVSIPEKIKKRLLLEIKKWQDLPIKWVKESNFHITLVFLGLFDDDIFLEVLEKIRQISEKTDTFNIEFDKIALFPSNEEPKTIALIGTPSEELKDLVNTIEEKLGISSALKKSFRPHITLGRIRKNRWEALEVKPTIQEDFKLPVDVNSIELMSSQLDEDKINYTILESFPLQ